MKRSLLWLTMPLLVVVSITTIKTASKTRAESAKVAEEAKQIRALLSQSTRTTVTYFSSPGRLSGPRNLLLSKAEFAPFVNAFSLVARPQNRATICYPQKGVLVFQCQLPPHKQYPKWKKEERNAVISFAVAERDGQISVRYPGYIPRGDQLAPLAVQRWIELARANPRFGPTLISGMK